jgi:hypothetical protein
MAVTQTDTYHVIVNLSVETADTTAPEAPAGVDAVQELVESRLRLPSVRVSRITVYRGVENE